MEHLSAWALLSLAGRSAPGSPTKHNWSNYSYEHSERAIAKLRTREFEYMIRQKRITIGRSSQRLRPDVSMGHSKFISRLHLEIYYDAPNFYMICNSRNGVFVDGIFRRKNSPLQLPKHCLFRFPSTNIRLVFQSLIDDDSATDEPMSTIPKTEAGADTKCAFTSEETIDVNQQHQQALQHTDQLQPIELLKDTDTSKLDTNQQQHLVDTSSGQLDNTSTASLTSGSLDRDSILHHRDNSTPPTPQVKSGNQPLDPEPPTSWTSRLAATFDTPALSPAGTISATNSCPTSPRPFSMVYANTANSNFMNNVDQGFADSANEIVIDTDGNTTTMHSIDAINLALNCPYLETGVGQLRPEQLQKPTTNGKSSSSTLNSSTRHSEDGKPPYSYAQLIVQAISAAHDKQSTLNGIYSYITKNYPYYRTADKGWQNSIRHNLSLNRYFVKVPRSQEEPGKGSFWRIEAMSEPKLLDQAFRRRRQRPAVSSSRSSKMSSSKSAPVSPSGGNLLHSINVGGGGSDAGCAGGAPSVSGDSTSGPLDCDTANVDKTGAGEDTSSVRLESACCSVADDAGSSHHEEEERDEPEIMGHQTPDPITSSS